MQFQTIVALIMMSAAPAFAHPAPQAMSAASTVRDSLPIQNDLIDRAAEMDNLMDRAPKTKCPQPTSSGKTLSFKPLSNKTKTTFVVDESRAIAQMAAAGFTSGLSGDPHHFVNGGREVVWDVPNCDSNSAVLMEYPVYWNGAPKGVTAWDKNAKASKQLNTPLRVVFAVKEGCQIYCGVMGHSIVEANFSGKGKFIKAT